MKKIQLLLLCFIAGISVAMAGDHPSAHFGEFGLYYFPNAEGYKQYVGQVVEYLPEKKPSYKDEQFSKIFQGKFNTPYVIKKVSGNDKRIKFELVERDNPSIKIKFEFLNYSEIYSYGKNTFANTEHYRVPLFFPERFSEVAAQYKGTPLKAQGDVYLTIENLELKYLYDGYPMVYYVISNPLTGSISSIPMKYADEYTKFIGKSYSNLENSITLTIVDVKGSTFYILNSATGEITEVSSSNYSSKESTPDQYAKLFFDASKNIGKIYSDPECNFTLTVTDAKVERFSNKITYSIRNSSNDKINKTSTDLDEYATTIFSNAKKGKYIASLKKVIKPINPSIRYGKTTEVQDSGMTKYSYIDNVIDIIIFATSQQFSFILKNVSPNSIKIIWDEAAFVDTKGTTSKVMHAGTRYSERNSSQPATTIIQNAKIEDIATPIDRVRYSDYFSKWVTDPMFPSNTKLKGQQIQLMLPIQIKNIVNEYVFIFELEYVSTYPELLTNPNL